MVYPSQAKRNKLESKLFAALTVFFNIYHPHQPAAHTNQSSSTAAPLTFSEVHPSVVLLLYVLTPLSLHNGFQKIEFDALYCSPVRAGSNRSILQCVPSQSS
jgi:hypothetical protein